MLVQKSSFVALVEDDAAVRKAIVSLLGAAGIRTASFATGEAFLRSTHAHAAGCLIVDLQLGGMSGLELQHCLVKMESRMPIIFVTAHEDSEGHIRDEALNAGAAAFLHKPFDDVDLLRAIETALGGNS